MKTLTRVVSPPLYETKLKSKRKFRDGGGKGGDDSGGGGEGGGGKGGGAEGGGGEGGGGEGGGGKGGGEGGGGDGGGGDGGDTNWQQSEQSDSRQVYRLSSPQQLLPVDVSLSSQASVLLGEGHASGGWLMVACVYASAPPASQCDMKGLPVPKSSRYHDPSSVKTRLTWLASNDDTCAEFDGS